MSLYSPVSKEGGAGAGGGGGGPGKRWAKNERYRFRFAEGQMMSNARLAMVPVPEICLRASYSAWLFGLMLVTCSKLARFPPALLRRCVSVCVCVCVCLLSTCCAFHESLRWCSRKGTLDLAKEEVLQAKVPHMLWVKGHSKILSLGSCVEHASAKVRDGVHKSKFGFPQRGHLS